MLKGKSSIALALFRILEESEGCIMIDGIDIRDVDLHGLRKRLTIIPQDPFLFSGSIRLNLDPNYEYSDYELWKVLKKVNLKEFIMNLKEGLAFECSEGGANLR
jgi:ATP-binding cassette subfamily C (CFTR/MRP) protein 1